MKVTFVCTGNTCRSPMAQYLAQAEAPKRGIARIWDSAGLFAQPWHDMSFHAVRAVFNKTGVMPPNRPAKLLTQEIFDSSDRIVAITEAHRELIVQRFKDSPKIIAMPEDIPDPYGGDSDAYEVCADRILSGIQTLFDRGLI